MAEIALFAALLVLAYLFFSSTLASRRVRRLKKRILTEQTRSAWAEARAALFALVREEKLDPQSATFRTFYQVQTYIMRRPDNYAGIANALTRAVLTDRPKAKPVWWGERKTWPPEMKQVFAKMSEGTMLLVLRHSGIIRMVRTAYKLGGNEARRQLRKNNLGSRLMKKIPQDRDTKQLLRAKRRVDRLQLSVA